MVQRFRLPLVLSILLVILLSACEKPLHDPSEQAPLLVPDATQVPQQEIDNSAAITLPEPEPTLAPTAIPEPTSLPAPSADNNAADEAYPEPVDAVVIEAPPTATPITLPAAEYPTATPIVIPAPQVQVTTIPVPTINLSALPTEIPAPAQATFAPPTPNPTWVFEQTRDAQNNSFNAPPVPTNRSHTVIGGDTVFALSQIYGVSADAIAQANFLDNFFIFPGQVLTIPAVGTTFTGGSTTSAGTNDITHTVLAGQTLYSIATSYGVTVEQVTAYNGLLDPTLLSVGQVIFIPR